MNYLYIYGYPILIGLTIRILLQILLKGTNKACLVTVVFAVLAIAGWVIVHGFPLGGSELFGILAVQETTAFVSSLLTGIVLKLKAKRNSENSR